MGPFVSADQKRRTSSRKSKASGESATESPKRSEREGAEAGRRRPHRTDGAGIFRIKELERGAQDDRGQTSRFRHGDPEIPHESVVYGTGSEDNPVVRMWGKSRSLISSPSPTGRSGRTGILDFARGRRSPAPLNGLQGCRAKLERAITNFMLDLHTSQHGYTEVLTPSWSTRPA